MRTSIRGILAAATLSTGMLAAPAALAQDTDVPGPVEVSANIGVVTDYRFRGVSLTEGDPAVQGGLDIAHESGFYIGTWASNIVGGDTFGEVEVDLYAGFATQITPLVSLDVGATYYAYPTGDGPADYYEPYAKLGAQLGPVEAGVGVYYAPDQESLGDEDNLYVSLDLGAGIPNTPLTVSAHAGYTDGVLAPDLLAGGTSDNGWDYSVGLGYSTPFGLDFGVSYIATDGLDVEDFTDDAIVGSVSYSVTF